jgi:TetR/AcrR family transcriptional regulator, transcriptional repressor for nem operon
MHRRILQPGTPNPTHRTNTKQACRIKDRPVCIQCMQTEPSDSGARKRVLKAAYDEFKVYGFQGGGLNRIVASSGLTKGAVFHYFTGKQDLGCCVIRETITPAVRKEWIDPIQQTDRLAYWLVEVVGRELRTEGVSEACALHRLTQEMAAIDPQFRIATAEINEEWRAALESALEREIQSGRVRTSVDPRATAAFIVAAIAGMLVTARTSGASDHVERCLAGFEEYLRGLEPARSTEATWIYHD